MGLFADLNEFRVDRFSNLEWFSDLEWVSDLGLVVGSEREIGVVMITVVGLGLRERDWGSDDDGGWV